MSEYLRKLDRYAQHSAGSRVVSCGWSRGIVLDDFELLTSRESNTIHLHLLRGENPYENVSYYNLS